MFAFIKFGSYIWASSFILFYSNFHKICEIYIICDQYQKWSALAGHNLDWSIIGQKILVVEPVVTDLRFMPIWIKCVLSYTALFPGFLATVLCVAIFYFDNAAKSVGEAFVVLKNWRHYIQMTRCISHLRPKYTNVYGRHWYRRPTALKKNAPHYLRGNIRNQLYFPN